MPRSSRKRQSRLSFAPLGSSSPAALGLSPNKRERAAAVKVEGSPSPAKKRKLSPVKRKGVGESEDELGLASATPSQSRVRKGRDQGRLNFSNHGIIPRRTEPPVAVNEGSPVKPHSRAHGGMFGSTQQSKLIDLSSDSDEDSHRSEVVAEATKPPKKASKKKSSSKKKEGKAPIPQESEEQSEEELPSRSSRNLRSSGRAAVQDDDESEDDLPRRNTRSAAPKSSKVTEDIPIRSDHMQAAIDLGDYGPSDEEEMPSSLPSLRADRKASRSNGRSRKRKELDSFVVDDDEVSAEQDDDDLPVSRSKTSSTRPGSADMEDEDDSDVVVTQSRGKATPRRKLGRRQEMEDLKEDLEFFSPPSTPPRSSPKKKNARLEALERLKKQRARQNPETPKASGARRRVVDDEDEDEEEEDSDNSVQVVDEVESAVDEEEDEDELEEDSRSGLPKGLVHGRGAAGMFQEDEEDEGFVIDDDEALLGAPTGPEAEIPIEFTHLGRAKAKDLFKFAIEWMVQKQINPGFNRDEPMYRLAFQKLNDEVKGLAGSKFTSSIWLRDFTRALNARPNITVMELSAGEKAMMLPHCEACNRKTHPATWSITFHGKPYDEYLEELGNNDSSEEEKDDEEEGGDGKDYDKDGYSLPPEEKMFFVGVFCKTNAETSHTLQHWRYHLNEWVIDYLRNKGYFADAEVVKRSRWSLKKKEELSVKIREEMEQSGEIRRLYHDYRLNIDHARDAKQTFNRGRF